MKDILQRISCGNMAECENETKMVTIKQDNPTVPNFVLYNPSFYNYPYVKKIFYISDIHLEHRLINSDAYRCSVKWNHTRKYEYCIQEKSEEEYAVKFAENEGRSLAHSASFNYGDIVLFLGDVSCCLNLSEAFYNGFCQEIIRIKNTKERQRVMVLISEKKKQLAWVSSASYEDLKQEAVKLRYENIVGSADDLRKRIQTYISDNIKNLERTLDEIDQQKRDIYNNNVTIISILGNHELWGFASYTEMIKIIKKGHFGKPTYNTIDACRAAYRSMFERLGIVFLDNSTYEKGNIVLFGGTGFAGYNSKFNATNAIYLKTVSRNQEIDESARFETEYNNILTQIQEKSSNRPLLVVASHNPISDWKKDGKPDVNVVYFNGHSHHNHEDIDLKSGIAVYAGNQIGYRFNGKISLKLAYLYLRYNPLAGYKDGAHEITIDVYSQFLAYMEETQSTLSNIRNHIEKSDYHLYVVKHEGYYGFFLIGEKAFICNGGKIRKASFETDIKFYDSKFLGIVNMYVELLKPYRKTQEKISAFVRSFRGSGKIHGLIVDIDFYNHIMLNPYDGTLTLYYSPYYGKMERYSDIYSLLEHHNPALAASYKSLIGDKKDSNSALIPLFNNIKSESNEFEEIDIANSLYSVSIQYNKFQALFDKKILREWPGDIELLKNLDSKSLDPLTLDYLLD